jgi:hypothetical protein
MSAKNFYHMNTVCCQSLDTSVCPDSHRELCKKVDKLMCDFASLEEKVNYLIKKDQAYQVPSKSHNETEMVSTSIDLIFNQTPKNMYLS